MLQSNILTKINQNILSMTSVTEFKKLFEKFLRENKSPTGEIVKKKYYFPVDQLKVRTFSKIYNLLINLPI